MTTALATTSSGFLAAGGADAFAALEEAASEMGGTSGQYLKFNGNDGIFTYGSGGTELDLKSQVAFNPFSLERGWICWKDGSVIDERMVPYLTGKPALKQDLPDNGPYDDQQDGWQEQMVVNFKMTDTPFADLIFKATGVSKMNAVKRLIADFTKSYKQNPGLVPIVEIDENEFESKAKGARNARKHAPVFKIVAWVPESSLVSAEEGSESDYEGGEAMPQLEAPAPVAKAAPAAEAPAAGNARQAAARRGRF